MGQSSDPKNEHGQLLSVVSTAEDATTLGSKLFGKKIVSALNTQTFSLGIAASQPAGQELPRH